MEKIELSSDIRSKYLVEAEEHFKKAKEQSQSASNAEQTPATNILLSMLNVSKGLLGMLMLRLAVGFYLWDVRLLLSLTGVNVYFALLIKSEIGDIRRFPNY